MKVAIAGYGKEGEANYRYWKAKGDEVVIFDDNPATAATIPVGAMAVCESGAIGRMNGFDRIIRTAGLSPFKLPAGVPTWSGTREFFAECPAPIIGVTGTKGKGTTCSMITEILRASGRNVHLVGNIGVPAIEELAKIHANDIVVFELSSFQLWDLERSPHVAVVLGIEPDHLDVHTSYDDYIAAKANIAVHQGHDDTVIFKASNDISASIAQRSSGTKVNYGEGGFVTTRDGFFYYGDTQLCPISVLTVPGAHNAENACAAIAAAWPYVTDADTIARGLASFTGLPHHIERVRELDGVAYYDDSFSSAPPAAVVAVQAFTEPVILILGGFDRGIDLTSFAHTLKAMPNIKKILCIGAIRTRLAAALEEAGDRRHEIVDSTDFTHIVRHARDIAAPGDIVLLSPGAPSFDMFKNFVERGGKFKDIVMNL